MRSELSKKLWNSACRGLGQMMTLSIREQLRNLRNLLVESQLKGLNAPMSLAYASLALLTFSLVTLTQDWAERPTILDAQVLEALVRGQFSSSQYRLYVLLLNAGATVAASALLLVGAAFLRKRQDAEQVSGYMVASVAFASCLILAIPTYLAATLDSGPTKDMATVARSAFRDASSHLFPSLLVVLLPVLLTVKVTAVARLTLVITISLVVLGTLSTFHGVRPQRMNNELMGFFAALLASAYVSWRGHLALQALATEKSAADEAREQAQAAQRNAELTLQALAVEKAAAVTAREQAQAAQGKAELAALSLLEEKAKYKEQSEAAVQALLALQQQFQQASDHRANFLGMAAHDLGHCLASVGLWASNVSMVVERKIFDEIPSCLENLQKEVSSMSNAFVAIIDYSKIEAGEIAPRLTAVRLLEVFEALQRRFSLSAQKRGLRLKFERPPSNCVVLTDFELLTRVLSNLVSNAIKYTTPPLEPREQGHDIVIRAQEEPFLIRVEVVDCGVGIAPALHEKIFDAGYQVDRSVRGHGLGLAAVKGITRSLGGHAVDLTSVEGQGSTFWVNIPLAFDDGVVESNGQTHAVVAASSPGLALDGALIAVAEDDPAFREAVSTYIRLSGGFVLDAGSLEEIQSAVRSSDREPDVILTDYNLPGNATGKDVIEALRIQCAKEIPAIVLTADWNAASEAVASLQNVVVISKLAWREELLRHLTRHYVPEPLPFVEVMTPSGRFSATPARAIS